MNKRNIELTKEELDLLSSYILDLAISNMYPDDEGYEMAIKLEEKLKTIYKEWVRD